MRTWFIGLAVLLLLGPAHSAPAPGDRISPFTLARQGGGEKTWHPGRVTVLSFCAFWCDTWKEQGRRIRESRSALEGLPVTFLTLSVDGRWPERGEGRLPAPILLDAGRRLSAALGVSSVPFTVVVGADGRVTYTDQGIVRGDALRIAVRGAITAGSRTNDLPVYLTFDDFPSGETDDHLLDILRAAGVHATFFCIGRNVEAHPDAVRRAVAEGHILQVHSWDHSAADSETARCAEVLRRVAGASPTLYRPPGSERIVRLSGESVGRPTVNPYDYTRPGEAELLRRILSATRPGAVILLHAGVSETQDILPDAIRALQQRGLAIDTLR